MADEQVLNTQKWLNKTYGSISTFDKCPENGKTGWPTIYSLIEGLQIELGVEHDEISPNFGDKTTQLYDEKATPKLINGYKGNLVYLIQGAFWCKGITPGGFDGEYSDYTRKAVLELQGDAGFDPDGTLNAMWAKALFDMSAFVLVPGGDKKVRELQQKLNKKYHSYFGILPCDGIYQRDTNTALIYALQSAEGMKVGEANGVYGPGTTEKTPILKEGDTGDFVEILQDALYVNGFDPKTDHINEFDASVSDAVLKFKQFMAITPANSIADLSVMKGLLSSAGDTKRSASGADTATQLSQAQIQTLVQNGIHTVGRYLTGSVGTGDNKRDKFLTFEELQNLFSAGLSVFPIYQDGGWDQSYFTSSQGTSDAQVAGKTATDLSIPVGTLIYFAVDVDIQDGDIDATVIPYFKSVSNGLKGFGYQVGIYGTRNICQRVMDKGFATLAFVSDMLTGYSGNLGFRMPSNWAFDQFNELSIGSGEGALDIDKVALSSRDIGFTGFADDKIQKARQKLIPLGELMPILKTPILGTVSFNQEKKIIAPPYDIYVKLTESADINPDKGDNVIQISNGKITSDLTKALTKFYCIIVLPLELKELRFKLYEDIASKIQTGSIKVSPRKRAEEPDYGVEITYKYCPTDGTKVALEWQVQIYLRRDTVMSTQPKDIDAYNTLLKLSQGVDNAAAELNLIRGLEAFSGMSLQQSEVVCTAIAAGGIIAVFGAAMLLVAAV
ncbi:glycoside hydrolase domain-containing protein [Lactococcus lactis]|uniref:glycoside hydrolase domain-containing protein n=1 Tax=Lactococcus lactis TaxID=1358 RepID=UPI00387791BA